MDHLLAKYLTPQQYKCICMHWTIITRLNQELLSLQQVSLHQSVSTLHQSVSDNNNNNTNALAKQIEIVTETLAEYRTSYEQYICSIGMHAHMHVKKDTLLYEFIKYGQQYQSCQ
jgi:hypothetical protein